VLTRMRRLALSLRLERLQRVRRQSEGDELDLDALLEAQADVRNGREPDPRLYFCARPRHDRGLASLVLLDLSESCNDPLPEAGHSLLELSRVAALLLGHMLETLGEAFALQGFNSNGRHQVECQHIKDFEETFDADIEARIAGLGACHSTRLGAALRHGLAQLGRRREHFRLLLVVTDGVPADIDVHDEDYLAEDVRAAVREGRRQGMELYCLSLDAGARDRMEKMFGAGRFRLLDHPGRLPELLPQLLLSLTRRY
jgi:nitric oxide reductase NorD protein